MIRPLLQQIRQNSAGVTAVEFALVTPVLLMMTFGIFDLGHNMYTHSMLQGAVQQAARKATIEGAGAYSDELDALVTQAVHSVSPYATLTFDRRAYANFSEVSQPEDYTDLDGDSTCNNGEPYEDANGSGTWDADRGVEGQGGARDAVLYTVTISYRRLFPVAQFIPGQTEDFTMQAKAVLRNQPYGLQGEGAPATGNCA